MTSKAQGCEKKKPYQKPNLQVYGNIRALTQTTKAAKGMADAVGKGAHKT